MIGCGMGGAIDGSIASSIGGGIGGDTGCTRNEFPRFDFERGAMNRIIVQG